MRRLLIAAELDGLAQTKIIAKCRTHHTVSNPNGFKGDDIRDVLELWHRNGYVQRFDVQEGYSKKPTRIWRATVELKNARL